MTAFEDEHDRLEEPSGPVETKAQLSVRPVVGVIQGLDPLRPIHSQRDVLVSDTVLTGARVDFHAANDANARRSASERVT